MFITTDLVITVIIKTTIVASLALAVFPLTSAVG